MPVAKTDMKLKEATTMGTSDSTTSVGGAVGSTLISSATVGQVHYRVSANASGGGDLVRYSKIFDVNDHATDDIDSYGIWMSNSIDTLGTAATIQFVSDSTSDDSTKMITVIGKSSGGSPQSENVTMNGTTEVTTTLTYTGRVRWILRNSTTKAVTTAAGTITGSFSASTVGVIPPGMFSATGEIDLGLAASLNDSATIATPLAAPSSVTFSKPRVSGSKLVVDSGGGTLTAGDAQGIWSRLTLPELMQPWSQTQVSIKGEGDAV